MSEIRDAYGERKKNEVIEDTWGHLAPVKDQVYGGYILYTIGCYGDITCIQNHFRDLPDSPWFFDDLHSYMGTVEGLCGEERGMIFLFLGSYCRDRDQKFIGVTQKMTAGILRDKIEKSQPKPTCNNCKHFDEICTKFPKEEWPAIWCKNKCTGFERK